MSSYQILLLLYCVVTLIHCTNCFIVPDERCSTPKDTSVHGTPLHVQARDCKDLKMLGQNKSGIYVVNPDNGTPFQVYCDMETEGGGWTVIQRRMDGSVSFIRNASQYDDGFGDLLGEFWLGNANIHRFNSLSRAINYNTPLSTLRIHLEKFNGQRFYAQYNSFYTYRSTSCFSFNVYSYSGNAGDKLSQTGGHCMSTFDKDKDSDGSYNCAARYRSGWFFYTCASYGSDYGFYSNLNGVYIPGPDYDYGIYWEGLGYSLKGTAMMIRRNI